MWHSAKDIASIFLTPCCTAIVLGQENFTALHGLERPQCMDGNLGALPPITQCPQKPRGRKPKAKATPKQEAARPSAAACGFDTVGMTDDEVAKRLKQNKEPCPSSTRKKTPKNSGAKRDSIPGAAGTLNKKPKVSPQEQEEDEHDDKAKAAKKGRGKRVKKDKKAVDPEPVEPKTRKPKRSSSSMAGTTKPKVRNTSEKKTQQNNKKNQNKSKKKQSSEKRNTAEEDAKAARKARVSRKSSAYHKAKKAAASQGLSPEEQIKAAKQAP